MIQEKVIFRQETLDLADSIGQFIEYWGFKRVHGRTWTLLFLSNRPLCTQNLLDNLKISKGLMSTSLQTLMDYGLIYAVEGENKKEKMYSVHHKIAPVIRYVLENREYKLLIVIKEMFQSVLHSHDPSVDTQQLHRLKKYISWGETLLKGVMKFSKVDLSVWKEIDSLKTTRPSSKVE